MEKTGTKDGVTDSPVDTVDLSSENLLGSAKMPPERRMASTLFSREYISGVK